jgi:hypothetical protein
VDGAEYLVERERVALGPLRRDFADTYASWMNRIDVPAGLAHLGLLDRVTEEAWLEETMKANAAHEPDRANFTVYAMDAVAGDFTGSVLAPRVPAGG